MPTSLKFLDFCTVSLRLTTFSLLQFKFKKTASIRDDKKLSKKQILSERITSKVMKHSD